MPKRPQYPSVDSDESEEASAVETSEAESEPIAKKSSKKTKAPVKKTKAASKSKSKKRVESEEDDDDFEEDEDEDEPAPKKRRTERGKAKPVKKSSDDEPKAGSVQTDKDGGKYIDLGNKRRATVRDFKGVTYVDIREFYEKDGQQLPGKKGISLNSEQWESLKQHIDTIDTLFTKKK